ncbi:MAG: type IX secretion system membrane protein PorP/SprF [Bacteroidetes bacterium]|nr:type IX secretion system membrane protein PorP/SprF [Bacteroidota bacterium]
MKKVIITCLCFCVAIFLNVAWAQDPNYSQYFATPLHYNPAFTGINTGVRARFTYRNQWPTLLIPYKSYHFSADVGARQIPGSGGIGLMINSDNDGMGFIQNTMVGLTIAVRVPITSYIISQIGIKAAYVQKSVDWDDFIFTDQFDKRYGNILPSNFIPPNNNKVSYPDFGAGGILQFSTSEGIVSGSLGFAADHLFQPDQSFLMNQNDQLKRRFVVHADAVIDVEGNSSYTRNNQDKGLQINPAVLCQFQGKSDAISAGLNLSKYGFYLGAWYKSVLSDFYSGSAVLLGGFHYNFIEEVGFQIVYSYDMPMSKNLQGTGGAHEISLVFEFDSKSTFGLGGRSGSGRGFGRTGTYSRWGRDSGNLEECPAFWH